MKVNTTSPPYDGKARTVDQLIERLECIRKEREAIIEELKRQLGRATHEIEKSWSTTR